MALIRCRNGHLFSEKKHNNICPYCSISVDNDRRTVGEDPQGQYSDTSYLDELEDKQRVVGWLVCIAGKPKGKDYRIMPGRNFLGRSGDMDIRVLGDNEINDRNHAIITYDAENNATSVMSGGDSKGLVYKWNMNTDSWDLTDRSNEKIVSGDRLKIGKCEFYFVSFCSEDETGFRFSWRDLDK